MWKLLKGQWLSYLLIARTDKNLPATVSAGKLSGCKLENLLLSTPVWSQGLIVSRISGKSVNIFKCTVQKQEA